MTNANIELLDQAIEWAERSEARQRAEGEPEWYQGSYFHRNECGTACCIAGWVSLHAGAKPLFYDNDRDTTAYMVEDVKGNRLLARDLARDALGLTEEQASWLFWGGNTLDVLKQMRDNLAKDREIEEGFDDE